MLILLQGSNNTNIFFLLMIIFMSVQGVNKLWSFFDSALILYFWLLVIQLQYQIIRDIQTMLLMHVFFCVNLIRF